MIYTSVVVHHHQSLYQTSELSCNVYITELYIKQLYVCNLLSALRNLSIVSKCINCYKHTCICNVVIGNILILNWPQFRSNMEKGCWPKVAISRILIQTGSPSLSSQTMPTLYKDTQTSLDITRLKSFFCCMWIDMCSKTFQF